MVNKITLLGRVGKEPDVRSLDNGKKVATFSLATSERYTVNGEKKETTEWHNIVAWDPLAGVIEKYVNKGDMLYIEGKITNRSYNDKDGNNRYITEIIARELKMLGGNQKAAEKQQEEAAITTDSLDDLPF